MCNIILNENMECLLTKTVQIIIISIIKHLNLKNIKCFLRWIYNDGFIMMDL